MITKQHMIKAVFFDIDGTLYRFEDDYVSASAVYAMKQLQAQGIKIIVCTGRSNHEYDSLPLALSSFPVDGLITSAGGVVIAAGKVLKNACFTPEEVDRIMSCCGRYGINLYFQDEDGVGLWKEPDETVLGPMQAYRQEIPLVREMKKDSVNHFIAFAGEEFDLCLEAELPFLTYHRSGPLSSDLYPANIDKSAGIECICAYFGIDPKQCMAFGDSFNDVEMLRHVGIGVAMGNGSELAKAAADEVCEAMDADGIYLTCLRHGLIQEEMEWKQNRNS